MNNALRLVLDGGKMCVNPSWADVCQALHRMNGGEFSIVSLNSEQGDAIMAAGGNNDTMLVSYVTGPNQDASFTLLGDRAVGPDVELVVEGVAALYPASQCVTRTLVVEVFSAFFKDHDILDKFNWAQDI